MQAIELLKEWIAKANARGFHYPSNEWLTADEMEVYVRRGIHVPAGLFNRDSGKYEGGIELDRALDCLDIANVNVYNKGRGIFTRFLQAAYELCPWEAVYVECVRPVRLQQFLAKQGYTCHGNPWSPCYFKLKQGAIASIKLKERV